ncbi:hypothetical protein V6N11_067742 [Hibiscus sabdariffa]|uniref:Uncharacterized protein n=1 Tax=Hibiscus sabdariffa TaxID=183260 RepID=A0ABR2SSF1_9ROSI
MGQPLGSWIRSSWAATRVAGPACWVGSGSAGHEPDRKAKTLSTFTLTAAHPAVCHRCSSPVWCAIATERSYGGMPVTMKVMGLGMARFRVRLVKWEWVFGHGLDAGLVLVGGLESKVGIEAGGGDGYSMDLDNGSGVIGMW